jgi:hypothetical protein
MRKILLLLPLAILALALPVLADGPVVREVFPSDYTPQPCAADTSAVCKSFNKEQLSTYGGQFRGFDLRQTWVNEHWDEMRTLFVPFCAKIANCFTVKDNDWVYCVDLLREDFLGTCVKFPEGSEDRRQCSMFAMTYYLGLGAKTALHKTSQECVDAQPPAAAPRKLAAWIQPQTYTQDFNGEMYVNVYDAETHIPVRAKLTIDGGTLTSTEGPVPIAFYPSIWRAGLKLVPNAQGHRDTATPTATLTATGYEPLSFPIAIDVPKLTVEMSPAANKLKRGMNTITVTTRDAATGQPVEMRVMAGDRTLGPANTPLQFEWPKGKKRPEIWVTSLFDRYGDVVIAPAR